MDVVRWRENVISWWLDGINRPDKTECKLLIDVCCWLFGVDVTFFRFWLIVFNKGPHEKAHPYRMLTIGYHLRCLASKILFNQSTKWRMQALKCLYIRILNANTTFNSNHYQLWTVINVSCVIKHEILIWPVFIKTFLKGVLQRTFFISTNERLMYKFYKNCNYFIFK